MKRNLLRQRILLLGALATIGMQTPSYGEEKEGQEISVEMEETSPVVEINKEEIELASSSNALAKEEKNEEEILETVVNYCGTTTSDLMSLVNYIKRESSKNIVSYQNEAEILNIFYQISQTPWEEKVSRALENSGLTEAQLNVVASIVSAESKKTSSMEPCYIDSFGVINNLDSRTHSLGWISCGRTIYEQATKKGQYVVYPKYSNKYLGVVNRAYIATVDYLYADAFCRENNLPLLKPTRWTQFRSPSNMKPGRTQLVPNGNAYFDEIKEGQLLEGYIPTKKVSEFLMENSIENNLQKMTLKMDKGNYKWKN